MRKIIIFIFTFTFVFNGSIFSKECPSKLYSNLHYFRESGIFGGAEFKGFFYNYLDENYRFGSATFVLGYESDKFTLNLEGMMKKKDFIPCENYPETSPFKIRRLNIEYYLSDTLTLKLGRSEITFGNGLILDDFFDSFIFSYEGDFDVDFGAGLMSIDVSKEALSCQKCYFYIYRNCWKNLLQKEWGDVYMGFFNLSYTKKGFTQGLLFVVSMEKEPYLNTYSASFYGKYKMLFKTKLFYELAIQYLESVKDIAYGASLKILKGINTSYGNILIEGLSLYGSEETYFYPLFGNTSLSEVYHYTPRQGLSLGCVLKFHPSVIKNIKFKAGYFGNISQSYESFISDEFDLSTEVSFDKNGKYRIIINHSILRGIYERSLTYINLRIII